MVPQTTFMEYLHLIARRSFKDFGRGYDLLVEIFLAVTTTALQVKFKLGIAADWKNHPKPLVLSLVAPYLAVLVFHIIWRVGTAPWKVYKDREAFHAKR